MATFTRAQLEATRDAVLPDILPDGPLRLLFVGINPGLWTTAAQAPFARPGNRFWPALAAAGLTCHLVDASGGLSPVDRADLLGRGIGFTNIAPRTTARADELTREELRAGGEALRSLVRTRRPAVVAVLGVTAYRTAFGVAVKQGRQDEPFEGSVLWVLGNPSGLNAHETVTSLAATYGAAAREAGVLPESAAV